MTLRPAIAADPAELDAEARIAAVEARKRAVALRQLEVLDRLAEAGLKLTLAMEREVNRLAVQGEAVAAPQAPAPEAAPESSTEASAETPVPARATLKALTRLSMIYARTAKAVRVTLMLQSRVMADFTAAEIAAARAAPDELARVRQTAVCERKRTVQAIVRRIGEGGGLTPDALDALTLDTPERLDDEIVYGDLMTRPLGPIVARLCRDLGLDADWTRLAQEAWAEPEMAPPAPPGSPFRDQAQGKDLGPGTMTFTWLPIERSG